MSNPKQECSSGSKSSEKGFSKEAKTTQQESSISEPNLGITLAPDPKQVSETKAVISDVLSRIEKIKQENEEAKQDWGSVEQNAYDRLREGSTKNISREQFLSWLSGLEQGHDV
jgi:hypothetical protein